MPRRNLILCTLASLLALAGPTGCADDLVWYDTETGVLDEEEGGCELSCSCSGGSLGVSSSCGTGSRTCSYAYDSYGRVDAVYCSYSNGLYVNCYLNYDSMGRASGSCSSVGDSCSFSC